MLQKNTRFSVMCNIQYKIRHSVDMWVYRVIIIVAQFLCVSGRRALSKLCHCSRLSIGTIIVCNPHNAKSRVLSSAAYESDGEEKFFFK